MKKLLFVPILTLAVVLCVTSMASAQWEITPLTDNTDYDSFPQINASGHVVWHGSGGSDGGDDYEIFYYDGSTVTQLTTNTYDDWEPQINASGHVVWHGRGGSDNGTDNEIFYYDGSTVTQLTIDTKGDSSPQINDSGYVVWYGKGESDNGTDNEIFYYDGSTVTQLTNNIYDEYDPQINDSGHVVWQGYDGSDSEIFYYDGSTVTPLTTNIYDDVSPQINASGHVVWRVSDGGDNEIFYYDGSSVTQLTNNTRQGTVPQINASGHVVWENYDGTDWEIFYYDGSSVTQLTTNIYDDYEPQINACGHVVWIGENDTDDNEIFYYDGSSVTQLTNNTDFNSSGYPQINDSGHVVWRGSDGSDYEIEYEIFLAENDNITCIDLDDYNLSIWNFSGTYDEHSLDNMTTLEYTLIQDAKGKITGFGNKSYYSSAEGIHIENITLDIKGKVKGKNNEVTVKIKTKGDSSASYEGKSYTIKSKDKITLGLNAEKDALVGTSKGKVCAKGAGCESGSNNLEIGLLDNMTGEAMLLIDSDNQTGKFSGTAELILSNQEKYPLSYKGKHNSKKGETRYQLKGDNETTKGIKFKLKMNESDNATQINGKAFGQTLKYKKE